MTTIEHLDAIIARCNELLALADKARIKDIERMGKYMSVNFSAWVDFDDTPEVTNYFAACVGTAEAGWRSTIAAINKLRFDMTGNAATIDIIIAAWPPETLAK